MATLDLGKMPKPSFYMTTRAFPSLETSIMVVLVTSDAIAKFEAFIFGWLTMTLSTLLLSMLAAQRKAGFVVIKTSHADALPPDFVMTAGAIGSEAPLVHIVMTGSALCTKPQKRSILPLVTASTFLLLMFTAKRPAGKRMIKRFLLSPRPAYEFGRATQMLSMTFGAVSAAVLQTVEALTNAVARC